MFTQNKFLSEKSIVDLWRYPWISAAHFHFICGRFHRAFGDGLAPVNDLSICCGLHTESTYHFMYWTMYELQHGFPLEIIWHGIQADSMWILSRNSCRLSSFTLLPVLIGAHNCTLIYLYVFGVWEETHSNPGRTYKLHADVVHGWIQTQDCKVTYSIFQAAR